MCCLFKGEELARKAKERFEAAKVSGSFDLNYKEKVYKIQRWQLVGD